MAAAVLTPFRHIRVTFDKGRTLNTEIRGSEDSIRRYYIGNRFNFGDIDGPDRMEKAVKVEFLS
jgi:hypothetical protein